MSRDAKADFMRIYANLPAGARREIIAIIDEVPFSWNAAFFEINKNTELGEKILNKLLSLGIL